MVVMPYIAKELLHLPLYAGMTFSFVVFLFLTPGIANQYFLLPVIFACLEVGAWFVIYQFFTTIFLLGSNSGVDIPYIPALWNTVWFATLGWTLGYFVNLKPAVRGFLEHIAKN
jgi:hypothetical protein